MKRIQKKNSTAKGFRDTFNFYMFSNLNLVGELEIPYIEKYDGPLPNRVCDYSKHPSKPEEFFIHHYLFDYLFDGKNGLWYGCLEGSIKTKSYLNRMRTYKGVISPDYSVYIDLPLVHQLWNIYRDRLTCEWLRSKGLNVIFNLRWGDYRTYSIAFSGIEKHSVIAIGSHGLIKHPENRLIFMNGFKVMIEKVEPSKLVIYGPVLEEMKNLCEEKHIDILHFDCEQIEARKEKWYGWWK